MHHTIQRADHEERVPRVHLKRRPVDALRHVRLVVEPVAARAAAHCGQRRGEQPRDRARAAVPPRRDPVSYPRLAKVADLAAFLNLVKTIEHGANVRVKTCDLNGRIAAYTLKTDHHYWKGYQVYASAAGGWVLKGITE